MNLRKHCRLFASLLLLAAVVSPQIARAQEPDPKKVAEIMGSSDPAAWKLAGAGATITTENGETFISGPQGFTIDGAADVTAPTEYLMTYRLTPGTSAVYASFTVAQGQRADGTPQGVAYSMSAGPGTNYVSYATSLLGSKTPAAQGILYLTPVTDRSLAWSEETRQVIEAQIASGETHATALHHARVTIVGNKVRTWVNGRYVSELTLDPGTTGNGKPRLQFGFGGKLISFRAQPIAAAESKGFEPISITGHANASALNDTKIDHASLPGGAKGTADVNGVPFMFSAANAKGNDHLDVGQSWTRFGSLPGFFWSNGGQFGGRWVAADRVDPARMCFYIPKGRYKALHLIAVTDDRDDAIPIVSAQFYRPDAGHPFNFEGTVPNAKGKLEGILDEGLSFIGEKPKAVEVKLANGKTSKLYHVTIPLDADAFSWFTDLDRIGMEITKKVLYYRGYPDPLEYSYHGGGLPSSVQVYAMTLERADADIEITPENYGHIWTAPATPNYSFKLTNNGVKEHDAKVTIETRSYDGKDTTKQEKAVEVAGNGGTATIPVSLKPERYGLHELTVTVKLGDETTTYKRNFAFFHPDTRERGNWEEGRGSIFGFWPWNGGHNTPTSDKEIPVMAAAGAETSTANYTLSPPEIQELARKHKFFSESAFFGGIMYYTGFYQWYQGAPKWDPSKPEETAKGLIEVMKKWHAVSNDISKPTHVPFFAEPGIGMITVGVWPTHYGEGDYKFKPDEERVFEDMRAKYMLGATAIRKEWPQYKLLLPYGDPMNAVIFLKKAPESRSLIDGTALDMPGFERLPEQQVTQVVLNRLYPILKDIKEYVPNPYLVLIEGFCISSKDLDTGYEGQAQIGMRDFLILMGYGVTRFESNNAPFECANYWGENHYGAGWMSRLPVAQPKLGYVHYGTLTRHLNRQNFSKYVPTGSLSTFCQQFKHYKSGHLTHVLWTIRGTREVSIKVPKGGAYELFDGNDNVTKLQEKNGVITFTVDQFPQYLEGLGGDAEVTLGEPDHSDAKPGKHSEKIANLGDGSWEVVQKADKEYETNKSLQIERFLTKMTGKEVDAPKEQGKKALAVHLPKQEKDRGVMPFYTTVEPKKPIEIDGKAKELGLWVHASSDWGRFVYFVRDAKGEKWISVGTKDDWNCDDIHAWSSFSFDGWRYLTFQLPSNQPYDSYRDHGTSWWGSYGGDGIVDLPIKLEKIVIERRPKAVYGAAMHDTKPDDVLLGDMYAEYTSKADKGKEAVRLSKLRMPLPKTTPLIDNPIAGLEKTGVGAPTKVKNVTDPEHFYDGTRCHVNFDEVPGATKYDVWVSPYADGRGAIQLATGWTKSGELIQGLKPDKEFYAFVVYTDKDGKLSKPSAPLAFTLKDRFGYK